MSTDYPREGAQAWGRSSAAVAADYWGPVNNECSPPNSAESEVDRSFIDSWLSSEPDLQPPAPANLGPSPSPPTKGANGHGVPGIKQPPSPPSAEPESWPSSKPNLQPPAPADPGHLRRICPKVDVQSGQQGLEPPSLLNTSTEAWISGVQH